MYASIQEVLSKKEVILLNISKTKVVHLNPNNNMHPNTAILETHHLAP